jgi:hypothetical protein
MPYLYLRLPLLPISTRSTSGLIVSSYMNTLYLRSYCDCFDQLNVSKEYLTHVRISRREFCDAPLSNRTAWITRTLSMLPLLSYRHLTDSYD